MDKNITPKPIDTAYRNIRQILEDAKGNDKDYYIESCPLLLAVDKIYAKIRSLKYRYIKDGTLFPDEEIKYLKGLGLMMNTTKTSSLNI